MQQFNLEEWLQDKSRKVVTRRGNPVRIICTDRKHGEDDLPIVFLEQCLNGEFLLGCRKDGRCDTYDTQYDLFFADEEEELTELQKTLEEDCDCYVELYNNGKQKKNLESGLRLGFLALSTWQERNLRKKILSLNRNSLMMKKIIVN